MDPAPPACLYCVQLMFPLPLSPSPFLFPFPFHFPFLPASRGMQNANRARAGRPMGSHSSQLASWAKLLVTGRGPHRGNQRLRAAVYCSTGCVPVSEGSSMPGMAIEATAGAVARVCQYGDLLTCLPGWYHTTYKKPTNTGPGRTDEPGKEGQGGGGGGGGMLLSLAGDQKQSQGQGRWPAPACPCRQRGREVLTTSE